MKTVYAVMDPGGEYSTSTLLSIHETRESAERVCSDVREAHREYNDEFKRTGVTTRGSFVTFLKTLSELGYPDAQSDVYVKEWEVKP